MKYLFFGFSILLVVWASVDILVLGDVARGMTAIVVASNILILAKLDENRITERAAEEEKLLIELVDKVCPECQSGKELWLNKENFYCHLDGPLDEWYEICKAHAIHDKLNSWAVKEE